MSEYCPAGFMIGAWGLCGPEKEEGKVCRSTVLQSRQCIH